MTLTLYGHPLAMYCHKVLIALYENGTGFTFRQIDFGDPADSALMKSLTPMGKMPALQDDARGVTLGETSVIIEYLDHHYPGPAPLLPRDPDQALQTRIWDRVFDIHVSNMLQLMTHARLSMPDGAEPIVMPFAQAQIDRAYAGIEAHLHGRDWAAGDFGMADCAAAPALFYTGFLHPFDGYPNIAAYFERLLARPSVARTFDQARPFLQYFPFPDRVPARFL